MQSAIANHSVRPKTVALVLALLTLLVYTPVLRHNFLVLDDPDYVTNNSMVRDGISWAGITWAFTSFKASNWHPLTWLSLMFDAQIFGLDPSAFHIVNLLLHATNSLLVFFLFFQITRALWPAAVIAALFAWHPLHVESVAWIAERKDVLSACFGLLSLLAYARWIGKKKSALAATRFPYAALLFFALGLLSKPMLVTLPFLMVLLDYWPLYRDRESANRESTSPARNLWRFIIEKWPFFVLVAGSCVLTVLAQRASAIATLREQPLPLRITNALVSCWRYLGKCFFPTNLTVQYPMPEQMTGIHAAFAGAALLAVTCLFWLCRNKARFLLIGWLWFLGMLVPVVGLVQVGSQAMADRYTYLPLLGIFLLIAYGGELMIRRFFPRPLAVGTAVVVVLGACLMLTHRQLGYWKDSESLFTHAIVLAPNDALAHLNLGAGLEQAGRRYEALCQYREAMRLAEEHPHVADTLASPANKSMAYAKLAAEFYSAGYSQDAIQLARRSLELAHEANSTDLISTMQQRLQEYERSLSH